MNLTTDSWVITTDSTICRIYEYEKSTQKLTLREEMQNPENKLRVHDLTSDKPGRYKASNGAGGAYSQTTNPKEIIIDNFSREIAKALNHGRNANSYQHLILIATAHMKGLLLKQMDLHVKNLLTHTIEKDVLHLSHIELLEFLKTHTKYPSSP